MSKKRIVKIIISIFLVAVIVYCLFNILSIVKEYIDVSKADKYLRSEFIISEISDTNDKNTSDSNLNNGKKSNRLKINWEKLMKTNSDVIGWIDIPDTNISYPILKGKSNEEYLNLDINKKYIKSGSIFVDSDNKKPFIDFNTIIYGHNLLNSSMFSDLEKYNKTKFADSHPIVYIYTPDGECLEYKVFSFHKANSMDAEIYITDVKDKAKYINTAKKENILKTDIDESKISRLITMSTCTNAYYEERYVLHAVLLDSD